MCGLEQLRDLYRAWERRVEAQIWVARHGDAVLAQLLGAQTFADSHVHAGAVGLGVGVDEAAADALCARIAKDDTHFTRRVGKWPSYTWTDAGKDKYAALARVRRGAWGRAPPAGSAPDAPVTPPAPSGDRSPVDPGRAGAGAERPDRAPGRVGEGREGKTGSPATPGKAEKGRARR